jgi:methionine--tRNA ligase beta chain
LLGRSPEQSVEIDQWLTFASLHYHKSDAVVALAAVDEFLVLRSYLAGQSFTVADAAVFVCVSSACLDNRAHVRRWYRHVASLPTLPPTLLSLAVLADTNPAAQQSTEPTEPPAIPATSKGKKVDKSSGESKDKEVKDGKDKGEKEKEKEKEKKVGKDIPPAVVELNPMRLDIRVGVIVKCWNHTEADKLLCEEIDVGEDQPRLIASGLRAHYTAEAMTGQRVVVLANLKERSMVGFKSQGMVLCSCNADHSIIKLVQPPSEAKPGDRITFPGFEGDPATPNEMVKKKVLEGLAPYFVTDEHGVAKWKDAPFTVTDNACTSELANGTVS